MFLDFIHRPVYISKHNVSETGVCLRLQAKPTQLGPIDRASPCLRTPVPAPRWSIQAKHSTNHLRELRQNIKILRTLHVWGLAPRYYQHRKHHWRNEILVWYQQKKNKFSHSIYSRRSCSFFYFCCDNGSPDGRDDWPDGPPETCGWIPCISYMWCCAQSARPSLHSNIFCVVFVHMLG
jgi:hypothetical protein